MLISDSLPHSACPIEKLTSALAGEHGVSPTISRQILKWFGSISSDRAKWNMDVDEVVKELGLGILREYPRSAPEPVGKEAFMGRWKERVGDTFMDKVELKLLAVSGTLHSSFRFARPQRSPIRDALNHACFDPAYSIHGTKR